MEVKYFVWCDELDGKVEIFNISITEDKELGDFVYDLDGSRFNITDIFYEEGHVEYYLLYDDYREMELELMVNNKSSAIN